MMFGEELATQVIELVKDKQESDIQAYRKYWQERQTKIWQVMDILFQNLAVRSPPYLTRAELQDVMKWKLKREKFRPRLLKLVAMNTDQTVRQVTQESFARLPQVVPAMEKLMELKGIGVATASIILSIQKPDLIPFLSEGAYTELLPKRKLQFSMKDYKEYLQQMQHLKEKVSLQSKETVNFYHLEQAVWLLHHKAEARKAQV